MERGLKFYNNDKEKNIDLQESRPNNHLGNIVSDW